MLSVIDPIDSALEPEKELFGNLDAGDVGAKFKNPEWRFSCKLWCIRAYDLDDIVST